MPIEYKNTSLIHAWQWAIGLEWYLMVQDPWRVVMSTDHPNGGSFLAYPQIIRLLMDRTYRQDLLKTAPRKVREQSALAGLDRQYTLVGNRHHHPGRARLESSASSTRATSARVPTPISRSIRPTRTRRPCSPCRVSSSSRAEIIVEQGEIREETYGKTLHVAPDYDRDVETDIQRWFEESYSIQWRNYPVDVESLHDHRSQ